MDDDPEQQEAAVKLQAMQRGRKAKKEVALKKEEDKSARVLQGAARSHQAKKEVATKQEAKKQEDKKKGGGKGAGAAKGKGGKGGGSPDKKGGKGGGKAKGSPDKGKKAPKKKVPPPWKLTKPRLEALAAAERSPLAETIASDLSASIGTGPEQEEHDYRLRARPLVRPWGGEPLSMMMGMAPSLSRELFGSRSSFSVPIVHDRIDRPSVTRCWRWLRSTYSPFFAGEDPTTAAKLTLRSLYATLRRKGERMGRYPYCDRIWRPLEYLVRENFKVDDPDGTIHVKWATWTNEAAAPISGIKVIEALGMPNEAENTLEEEGAAVGQPTKLEMVLATEPSHTCADARAGGESALAIAAARGFTRAVHALLVSGAWVDYPGNEGHTPMHRAAATAPPAGGGKAAAAGPGALMVEMLILAGADVNALNVYGESPLHVAARAGNAEIVKHLLKAGAMGEAGDVGGHTPAHISAGAGKLPVLKVLAKEGHANMHALSHTYETPLIRAVIGGGGYLGMQGDAREGAGKVGGADDMTGKFDHREVVAFLATQKAHVAKPKAKRAASPAKKQKKGGGKEGQGGSPEKKGKGKGSPDKKGGAGKKGSPPKGSKRKKG